MEEVSVELPDNLAEWLQDRYEAVMISYPMRKPRKINWPDGRRPTREELYGRADQCCGPCRVKDEP